MRRRNFEVASEKTTEIVPFEFERRENQQLDLSKTRFPTTTPMPASSSKPATSKVDRRRRHPRYAGDFAVTVSYFQGDQHQKVVGRSRDISAAGIGILAAAELSKGEVAGLRFTLPGASEPCELRAVIRYCRGCHYGFEFLSLTGEQRNALANYFKGREPID